MKRLEVRRFESLVGGLRGMGIRAADAENLKKQGIGTKMEEKSKPTPSSESQGAAPGRTPTQQFRIRICRARSRREFCTSVHRFAQSCEQNFIDVANGKHYLARQIEPGSFRTLRINLEGAASLTAVAPRD